MVTTIAVKEDTLEMLKAVKEEERVDSLDETIKLLVIRVKKPKRSMFGRLKTKAPFRREEIDRFD